MKGFFRQGTKGGGELIAVEELRVLDDGEDLTSRPLREHLVQEDLPGTWPGRCSHNLIDRQKVVSSLGNGCGRKIGFKYLAAA